MTEKPKGSTPQALGGVSDKVIIKVIRAEDKKQEKKE